MLSGRFLTTKARFLCNSWLLFTLFYRQQPWYNSHDSDQITTY